LTPNHLEIVRSCIKIAEIYIIIRLYEKSYDYLLKALTKYSEAIKEDP